MKQLNDLFNEAFSGKGIFYYLSQLGVMPWGSGDVSPADLDYHTHSGNKYLSVTAEALTEKLAVPELVKTNLAKIIWMRYNKQWTKLFEARELEYDPLVNYDRHEVHSGSDKDVKTPDGWKTTTTETPDQNYKVTDLQKPNDWTTATKDSVSDGYKEVDTQKPTDWKTTNTETPDDDYKKTTTTVIDSENPTKTHTVSLEADNGALTTNSRKAFNSDSFVETDKVDSKAKQDTTVTQTGKNIVDVEQTGGITTESEQSGTYSTEHTQEGYKQTEVLQTGTFATEHTQTGGITTAAEQSGTLEDKTTYGHIIDVKGNIGVTTSQQMLQSEIDIWSRWDIWKQIYEDIDKVLTLPIY